MLALGSYQHLREIREAYEDNSVVSTHPAPSIAALRKVCRRRLKNDPVSARRVPVNVATPADLRRLAARLRVEPADRGASGGVLAGKSRGRYWD